jgi:hypothetical protein
MDRLRKTLVLLAVIAAPAAAHGTFSAPKPLCFASGSATWRLAPGAAAADYRVRFDDAAPQPDLRMRLVDRPEIADFVLVDDHGANPGSVCDSAAPLRTVTVDAAARNPDVIVALSAPSASDTAAPDFRLYVHSIRFSHQDAAALLAAMWRAGQARDRAVASTLDR